MATGSQPGGLTDSHVLELSKRIESGSDLRDFGIKVLKMPEHVINTALYNHCTNNQSAAHIVLSAWRKQQTNEHEAYSNLITLLQACEMNQLAAELKTWLKMCHLSVKNVRSTIPFLEYFSVADPEFSIGGGRRAQTSLGSRCPMSALFGKKV